MILGACNDEAVNSMGEKNGNSTILILQVIYDKYQLI